jgi:hypothetical protein
MQTPDRENYEEIYGYRLLDDIHNLFPEILYDSYIFPNDTDSNRHLIWLRFRLSRHFTQRYRMARTNYERTQAARNRADFDEWTWMRQRATRQQIFTNSIFEPLDLSILGGLRIPPLQRTPRIRLHAEDYLWNAFFDAIPVYASQEQIETASDVLPISGISGEQICAICQEHEGGGDVWRRLRACDHKFHKECVDNWFGRNAHCPVCRHDIREPMLQTAPSRSRESSSEETAP